MVVVVLAIISISCNNIALTKIIAEIWEHSDTSLRCPMKTSAVKPFTQVVNGPTVLQS